MSNVKSSIDSVRGFRVAGVHAGLKADNALDLALIVSDRACVAAGVYTQNAMQGAPVVITRQHILDNPTKIRAIAVNTKCANAATGRAGIEDSRTMARMTADLVGCATEEIAVMSTGVVGTHLPMTKIEAGLEKAYENLGTDWTATASAIMTTDTHPKEASVTVLTVDGQYTIAGIAKGSGMIAPNMATMLSCIVTDAKVPADAIQDILTRVNEVSFNRVVVDGDTSPNDMVVLLANGASGVDLRAQADLKQFEQALKSLMQMLATEIVRDGEGVSKFITLHITGAQSDEIAKSLGNTIATSLLVKTAFAGSDANWGRIIVAAGRAGVSFDPNEASLWISPGDELFEGDKGLLIFKSGVPARFDESDADAIMAETDIYVSLDCGMGDGETIIWTCDLTHDYVSINADYRT